MLRQVGGPGQARIRAAKVLIVGAGGLGSPAALYLAAAGVGTIGLVDDDSVSLSNLQRQILYRTSDSGRLKTEAAAQALTALNPGVRIETHSLRLTPENAPALFGYYDLIADGSDNFETRFAVADAAHKARKVLVSAAVTEFEGQLSTFKAFDRLPNGERAWPCYRCLFPDPPAPGTVPSCSQTGVLGAAAGVMGSLQALEILKEITGIGTGMAGKLLIFEALTARFRTVQLPPDPACKFCA